VEASGDRAAAAPARPDASRAPAARVLPLGRWLLVTAVAANVFVAALIAAWLAQRYQARVDDTSAHAMTVAQLLRDRLVASFDRMDLALQEIVDDAETAAAAGRLDGPEIEGILAHQRSRTPDALALRVVDSQGVIRWGSPPVPEPVDVNDRDFVAKLRSEPDAGLLVSGPMTGRILNKPIMLLSRRISRADRSFAGVVTGSIELARLSEILSATDVGPHGIVTLRWSDLGLVASDHPTAAQVGSRNVSPALRAHVDAGHERGTYQATSTVDGAKRIFAFAKLTGYPLYVVVGLGREDALRDWWRLLAGALSLMLCFAVGSGAAVFAERRALRRRLEYEALLLERSEQLSDSEERFRTAFETSPDSVTLSRLADGVFVAVNEGFTRMSGWTAAEVLGRGAADIGIWIDPLDRDSLVRRLGAGGTATNVEARLRTRTGVDVDTLMSARLLTLRGERLLLAVTRDIRDWRRAEAERDRLRQEVQQVQKLESIGQLAGGVAHDFNNLLTVILSCAEGLRDDLAAGRDPDAESVGAIAAAGERARDLTRQLLAFARKQVSAPERLDLNAVVRGSEKLLRRTLREDIALVVELEPEPWPVWCDPVQIGQVLLNLCVNARDAMPDGGILRIETRNLPGAADAEGDGGDAVRLAVQDTGVGMTPEVQAHLFEPFFTTKPQGKGTGMGLATVHGIVTQSGGQVRVESQPGRGTRFEVTLPRTHRAPRPAAAVSARPRRGSETVLVVEDDPPVRAVTVRALESAGYRVLVASRASEALERAREAEPLDLLVTDVVMPGASGPVLAEELRRVRPTLRVLYVTGYAREAIAAEEAAGGHAHVLPKPFTPASLLDRVRAILDAAG
jgi:PAS domain S-box-containing protein